MNALTTKKSKRHTHKKKKTEQVSVKKDSKQTIQITKKNRFLIKQTKNKTLQRFGSFSKLSLASNYRLTQKKEIWPSQTVLHDMQRQVLV